MPLRADLLNPIPGPNPSGEDLRYNPIYDKIRAFGPDLLLLIGDNHYGNTWSARGHGLPKA